MVLTVVEKQGDESMRARKRRPAVSGKACSCNADYGFKAGSVSQPAGHLARTSYEPRRR